MLSVGDQVLCIDHIDLIFYFDLVLFDLHVEKSYLKVDKGHNTFEECNLIFLK